METRKFEAFSTGESTLAFDSRSTDTEGVIVSTWAKTSDGNLNLIFSTGGTSDKPGSHTNVVISSEDVQPLVNYLFNHFYEPSLDPDATDDEGDAQDQVNAATTALLSALMDAVERLQTRVTALETPPVALNPQGNPEYPPFDEDRRYIKGDRVTVDGVDYECDGACFRLFGSIDNGWAKHQKRCWHEVDPKSSYPEWVAPGDYDPSWGHYETGTKVTHEGKVYVAIADCEPCNGDLWRQHEQCWDLVSD